MCFFCETDKFLVDRSGTSQSHRLLGYDVQNANLLTNRTIDEQLVFLYLYSDIITYHNELDEKFNTRGNTWAKCFDNNDVMILSLMVHTRLDILGREIETHLLAILRKQKAAVSFDDLFSALKILKQLVVAVNYWCKNLSDENSLKTKLRNLLNQQLAPYVAKLRVMAGELPPEMELQGEVLELCTYIESFVHELSSNFNELNPGVCDVKNNKQHDALDLFNHLRDIFSLILGQCKTIQTEAKGLLRTALFAGGHSPQMALFLAFLQLLKYANNAINTIPSRTLNYYYKDVLKFRRRGTVADSVFANFFIEKKAKQAIIERGTKISAGKDDSNNEIIFFTNESLVIGHTSPKICLVVDGKNQTGRNNSEDLGIVSISYLNETSSSTLSLTNPQKIQEHHKVGLIIASSALNLPSGDRTITISISLSDSSFERLEQRMQARAIEVGQLEIDELYHKLVTSEISTEFGWYTIPKNCTHMVVSSRKRKSIDVIFNLLKNIPPIQCAVSHEGGEPLALPAVKLLLDSSYKDLFYFYSNLEIEKISIESTVKGYNSLTVQTDLGSVDASKLFNPFSAMPQVGNSFYVDLGKIIYNNPKNLSLNIEWANLPTSEGGFQSYYDGYPERVEDDSLVASLSLMTDNEWEPKMTPKQTVSLFDYEDATETGGYKILRKDKTIHLELDRFTIHENFKSSNERKNFKNLLNGFLKLELGGPKMAFGHREYPEILRDVMLKNVLAKNKKTPAAVPNKPYTPLIKSISIDYSLKSEINFAQNTILSQAVLLHPKDVVVRLSLFGQEELYPVETPRPFTILAGGDGLERCNKVYFGMQNVDTSILALHLQIDEKSVDDTKDFIAPDWEYLCNNRWVAFSSKDVIADGTKGLIKSGIVKLSVPHSIDMRSSIMPKDLFWVRMVNTNSSATSLPKILGVHTNAVECTRLVPECASDRNDVALSHISAGMLKNFYKTQTKNIKVEQPYPSFGLKPHETGKQLYARARERLRHKNRPISVWGYERVILEKFDEIAMVKCINHTSKNLLSILAPGHITIVVIPKAINNIYPPLASKYLLSSIDEYIRSIISPFVTIEVVNPSYEELKVIVELKLRDGYEKGMCIKLVEDDLSRLISPWSSFGKTKKFSLNNKIYSSDIFSFLSEKKYIETITKFSLIKTSGSGDEVSLVKINSYDSYIRSTYPWSIIVPASKHIVSIYEGDFSEKRVINTEACNGISSMSIDKDFVIGPWQQGSRITTNKIEVLDKELEESIETYCLIANTN